MPQFTPQYWRTLEAVFVACGFRFVNQEGSHRSYVKTFAYRAGLMQEVLSYSCVRPCIYRDRTRLDLLVEIIR